MPPRRRGTASKLAWVNRTKKAAAFSQPPLKAMKTRVRLELDADAELGLPARGLRVIGHDRHAAERVAVEHVQVLAGAPVGGRIVARAGDRATIGEADFLEETPLVVEE